MEGAFTNAMGAEFSGSWNVTALVARNAEGNFYTTEELQGNKAQTIANEIPLSEQLFIGVVQMGGESSGQVKDVKADYGGQLFQFSVDLGLDEVKTGTTGGDDSMELTSFDAVMDTLFTGAGKDVIDVVTPAGHSNVIIAGSGIDTVYANARDVIIGGSGNDTLWATHLDNNRLDGGAGIDTFYVGTTANRVLGGKGDDIINVLDGAGTNYLNGGAGSDKFWLVSGPGDKPGAKQFVMDFKAGEDLVGLLGVAFADLSFTQMGTDTLLSVTGTAVGHFTNVSAANLNNQANFAGLA
jgi:Ca2+-binding RTX toxin-like protein